LRQRFSIEKKLYDLNQVKKKLDKAEENLNKAPIKPAAFVAEKTTPKPGSSTQTVGEPAKSKETAPQKNEPSSAKILATEKAAPAAPIDKTKEKLINVF
jgi:hypothetical protein